MTSENIKDVNVEDKTNVIPDSEFQVNQATSTDLYHPELIQILTRVRKYFENRHRICVTSFSCVTLMTQLLMSEKCREVVHLGPEAFRQLCQKLRGVGRVKNSIRSTV
ncbi:hypothetical protein HN51_018067 [Arachis hypogaea]